jgi:Thioredoxin reductase
MYDAIIIGGGPAGLSAALNFGRGLKTALVIDAGEPRNRVTEESHGYLTQDGVSPAEFRKAAEKDALSYDGVSLERDWATNIEKTNEYFTVTTKKNNIPAVRCSSLQVSENIPLKLKISSSSTALRFFTVHGATAMN